LSQKQNVLGCGPFSPKALTLDKQSWSETTEFADTVMQPQPR